jgi:hypothetical protein
LKRCRDYSRRAGYEWGYDIPLRIPKRFPTGTVRRMDAPSHAATYERARRLANIEVWTVALQVRRLRSREPEDGEFVLRRWADFLFLITALTRVRRAGSLAARVPAIADDIKSALRDFDAALPHLKNMRDVAEHFDDYAVDAGRLTAISRKSLEVGTMDETTFQWLGYELNADAALDAAHELFRRIRAAQSSAVVGAKRKLDR